MIKNRREKPLKALVIGLVGLIGSSWLAVSATEQNSNVLDRIVELQKRERKIQNEFQELFKSLSENQYQKQIRNRILDQILEHYRDLGRFYIQFRVLNAVKSRDEKELRLLFGDFENLDDLCRDEPLIEGKIQILTNDIFEDSESNSVIGNEDK